MLLQFCQFLTPEKWDSGVFFFFFFIISETAYYLLTMARCSPASCKCTAGPSSVFGAGRQPHGLRHPCGLRRRLSFSFCQIRPPQMHVTTLLAWSPASGCTPASPSRAGLSVLGPPAGRPARREASLLCLPLCKGTFSQEEECLATVARGSSPHTF